MPEAGPPSNKFFLNSEESSVIVVTSIKPKGRPLSLRQQRLADFYSIESGRKRLKETSRREESINSKADRDNIFSEAGVTMSASFRTWINQSIVYPLMGQVKDEHHDDVKVLYPARDLLYSDSDVAVLSSCSSWCVGPPGIQDASSSRMVSERVSSVDEVSPIPYGHVGLVDGSSGVGDRYVNKPPDEFVLKEDVVSTPEGMERKGIQKPYRQVWHSLWEHHVGGESVRGSNSVKKGKPASQFVSGKVEIPGQITASANNISFEHSQRKQRRGVCHPAEPMAQTRITYRSKTATRSWGRPFHQRVPSMGTRVAHRKGSSLEGDGFEGATSLFDKKSKPRRCELSDKKSLPRAIATTATRPGTAVFATEKENCESSAEPKSALPNSKRGATEYSNYRSCHPGKPTKSVVRPRFSVPIKASRVPMDLLFKEMYAQKAEYLKRDADVVGRQLALKYRGMPNRALNSTEQTLSDRDQDASFSRDSRLPVHFNIPERSRSPLVQSGRRLYLPPLRNRVEKNVYDIESGINCCSPRESERKSERNQNVSNALVVSEAALPYPGSKSSPTGTSAKLGARGKFSSKVPVQNHFYGQNMAPRQSVAKPSCIYDYNMGPNADYGTLAAGTPVPLVFNDLAVSPDLLHDNDAVSEQAPTAFRFSHPNAPDVLISPPPNPQLRGDAMCVPVSDCEVPPVPVYTPCVQTVNIPHYYSPHSSEMIEENFIPMQPFFPQNVPFRPFMPSVDFSRFEPPPRPLSRDFLRATESSQKQLALEENSLISTIMQQVGIPTLFSVMPQSERTKPLKELLTFGAQVPSISCIPPKSITTRCSSSPHLETQDTNILSHRDSSKSNLAMNVLPEDSANVRKDDWLNISLKEPFQIVEPLTKQIRPGANIESGIKYSPCVEKTILVDEKDDSLSILDGSVSSWKLSPHTKATDPETECLQTSAVPLAVNVSGKNPRGDFEFEARRFDLKESRSVQRIRNSRNCSDTKLSTVTEVSAEAQPGSYPVTDVSGFDFNPSSASDPPTTSILEAGPLRIDCRNKYSVGLESCLTTTGDAFDTSVCEKVSDSSEPLASAEMVPYDEDHDRKSPLTGLHHRISNVKRPEKDNLAYPVASSDQQITDKENDLIESTTVLLDDILGDNRIAYQLNSSDTSQSRRRFQSLVARLDNIALHCKLSSSIMRPNEDVSGCLRMQTSCQTLHSRQEPKVERKDAFVQVPVLCSQYVETEPFTAEKSVPDFRAGLTLRIMSTVVDVPPVIKRTETVGTNTEDKLDEDLPSYTERGESVHYSTMKHNSSLVLSDQLFTTSFDEPISSFNGNRGQPVVPAPVTNKQVKRLKPFFRSHRDELANIYNLAAVHSLTVNTDKAYSSVLSREEKLRTDSNTSAEIRKDKHPSSWDDERNYHREHEQPGRAPKQHTADRRVSFRPVRRETDSNCPPGGACPGEGPEKNLIPESGRLSYPDDGTICQVVVSSAKDLRKLRKSEKVSETDDILEIETKPPSRAVDYIDGVDRPYGRTGGIKEKSCRKSGELFELSRPSCEEFSTDKVISLKRKPGCALCKKVPSSKKKGILKISNDSVGKQKPPDIPGTIVQFGLSNIVTPANVDSTEQVEITTATKTEQMSQIQSRHSRKTVKYIQSVASVIALEASKKSEPLKSGSKFKDDRSMVIIHDGSAIKNLNKDCVSTRDYTDRRASLIHRVDASQSTIPTICLTRSESNDVPDVESSPTPICTNSMQVAFTAIEPASGHDSKTSVFLDCSSYGLTPSFVDAPSKKVDQTTSTEDSSMGGITNFPESLNSAEKTPGEITLHKEVADLRETLPQNAVQSNLIETDPEHLSKGCMFTAMRRFIKNRSRLEPCARALNQYENRYPGFQFTCVPILENDCLPLDTIRYCSRCKLKHVNTQDWSATFPGESIVTNESFRRRTPVRRTRSSSKLQRCTVKACDAENFTDVTSRDEDNKATRSRYKRVQKNDCAQNKTIRASACERHESKPWSPPNQDPRYSNGAESGSSEILRGMVNAVSDELCHFVVGGSSPESPQSSQQVLICAPRNKEDCVDKQTHAIRTLPFDVASGEVFEMRHERCDSSLARRSVSSRKSGARASSAPAGQIRVSSSGCWPQAHSVYNVSHGPRRLDHKLVKLLDCDRFTCYRCEHRKAKQRVPSWMRIDKPRSRKEGEVLLLFDDNLELDDAYPMEECSCTSRKGV